MANAAKRKNTGKAKDRKPVGEFRVAKPLAAEIIKCTVAVSAIIGILVGAYLMLQEPKKEKESAEREGIGDIEKIENRIYDALDSIRQRWMVPPKR
ncbi:hypothetical protein GF412_02590 [Candidatus Micrarchaeota archaeon]|nr:hypothetical protein [Candidatus Micrarchaeota archaeon]MBD3417847.1 hypothetical protein [Candidatus Micrarchaeota archaeon]